MGRTGQGDSHVPAVLQRRDYTPHIMVYRYAVQTRQSVNTLHVAMAGLYLCSHSIGFLFVFACLSALRSGVLVTQSDWVRHWLLASPGNRPEPRGPSPSPGCLRQAPRLGRCLSSAHRRGHFSGVSPVRPLLRLYPGFSGAPETGLGLHSCMLCMSSHLGPPDYPGGHSGYNVIILFYLFWLHEIILYSLLFYSPFPVSLGCHVDASFGSANCALHCVQPLSLPLCRIS